MSLHRRILSASLGTTVAVVLLVAAASAHALSSKPANGYVTNGPVDAIAPTANAIYLGGHFTQVGPRTGPGVGINASTGKSRGLAQVAGGRVFAVAPDGSGGFFVGGSFTRVGMAARRNLAHILSSGHVDPGFSPDPDAPVAALAVSGSTVYAGGAFTSIGGQPRSAIAALDASTGEATSWNPDAGSSFSDGPAVRALAVSGSTVYAGGFFTSIGGKSRSNIAAVDATTGVAASWNPNPNSEVFALRVSGSTVYASGFFTSIGGKSRRHIAALNTTTGAATGWDPNADGNVYALAASGSAVYAAGTFHHVGGMARNDIAALNPTTGAATSWNPNVQYPSNPTLTVVNALRVSGSTVYAGGLFGRIGGQSRHNIAGLSATTGAATGWDPNANDQVDALAVSGSTVYAGGDFTSIGGEARHNLAALDPTTGALESWNPNATTLRKYGQDTVYDLTVSGSTVYVGGFFDHLGGEPRSSLGAVDATTGAVRGWDPNPKDPLGEIGFIEAIRVSGPTVYAGGYFATIGGKSRNNIAALDASTGAATSWNPNSADGNINALSVSGSKVYVGGNFEHIGGKVRNCAAVIDATTGAATSWNPRATGGTPPNPQVWALNLSGSRVYAGGYFTGIGGQPRNFIAAVNTTGGGATSWNPDAESVPFGEPPVVYALRVDGSIVYAGGAFDAIGGQPRSHLAALNAAGGAATSWDPQPDDTVQALALGPDGSVWVGGEFRGFPTAEQSGIARFEP